MNTMFGALVVLALAQAVFSTSSSILETTSINTDPLSTSMGVSSSVPAPLAPTPSASAVVGSSSAVVGSSSAVVGSSSAPLSQATSSSHMVSSVQAASSTQVPVRSTIQSSFAPSTPSSPSATPVLNSTTVKTSMVPTSSVVPAVTSSAAIFVTPTPSAIPVVESISFKDGNKSCFSAQVEIDFVIIYNITVKNVTQKEKTKIPLNGNNRTNVVHGNCSYEKHMAYFKIMWNERGDGPKHTFEMHFQMNNKTKTWNVTLVKAVFNTSDTYAFQKGTKEKPITATSSGKTFGSRKVGTNYLCDAKSNVKMTESVTATFENVILQPFSAKDKLQHSGDHCSADDDDDDDDNVVPIAVGAALGGLVLIVLVAYIIGRRRSNRGYEQV